MSIRQRTESVRPLLGLTTAAGLAAASAIHARWATGSTWPAASSDELADLVVGRRSMPGPAACATVAGALAVAAAGTARASIAARPAAPAWARSVAGLAAAALLTRGAGGVVADAAGLGDPAPAFRRWNRRLYNPLCLALGTLAAIGRHRRV